MYILCTVIGLLDQNIPFLQEAFLTQTIPQNMFHMFIFISTDMFKYSSQSFIIAQDFLKLFTMFAAWCDWNDIFLLSFSGWDDVVQFSGRYHH